MIARLQLQYVRGEGESRLCASLLRSMAITFLSMHVHLFKHILHCLAVRTGAVELLQFPALMLSPILIGPRLWWAWRLIILRLWCMGDAPRTTKYRTDAEKFITIGRLRHQHPLILDLT